MRVASKWKPPRPGVPWRARCISRSPLGADIEPSPVVLACDTPGGGGIVLRQLQFLATLPAQVIALAEMLDDRARLFASVVPLAMLLRGEMSCEADLEHTRNAAASLLHVMAGLVRHSKYRRRGLVGPAVSLALGAYALGAHGVCRGLPLLPAQRGGLSTRRGTPSA